jgi:hypothetical protein
VCEKLGFGRRDVADRDFTGSNVTGSKRGLDGPNKVGPEPCWGQIDCSFTLCKRGSATRELLQTGDGKIIC